jgi:tetratricopeptide (TPR) repeat protein/tRNA A-37 threonylcarbamoyl transferase component Bud32
MRAEYADQEQRLCEVLTAYYAALGDDPAPDPEGLMAAHPDLADELAEYFGVQDQLRCVTEPVRSALRDGLVPPAANRHAATTRDSDGTAAAEERDASAAGSDRAWPRPARVGYFGDYELIEELARGGMGVVYRARQISLNRLVALKMIRRESLATGDDRERFRREAEVVANLGHPHITPIYEVGEHSGHAYFTMGLAEGGSLSTHLSRFADDPRAAAQLLAALARAVHHAHQRGVLHRDLKPSNILLDAEGRPQVTDFGLARRIDRDSELTQSGAVLGTPSYMAPEQASGQKGAITTATDVYGLGAVLYTLLTGRPPFRADTVLETLEQVRSGQLEPPSTVVAHVDRDLETICLKCLEREPERRYSSAAEVAEDLERWLRGEPIAARPVGTAGRAWRWCRRNQALSALLATIALLLTSALAGLAWSNQLIVLERDEARRQRQRAEARSRQARRAVDDMYTQVAERWLAEQGTLTAVQREFLEKALAFYEELARDEVADPAIERERAKVLRRVGQIRGRLGQSREAVAALREALPLWRAICARDPDGADSLHELAETSRTLGQYLGWSGRWTEGARALEQAAGAYETLVGRHPEVGTYRSRLVEARCRLAVHHQVTGRPGPALEAAGAALATAERWSGDAPGGSSSAVARAEALRWSGYVLWKTGRYAEAERALRASIDLAGHLPAEEPAVLDEPQTWTYLGRLLLAMGRPREAEAALRQALAKNETLIRESPAVPVPREGAVLMRLCLAAALQATGGAEEAQAQAERAVQELERLIAEFPGFDNFRGHLTPGLRRLGLLRAEAGRAADAEAVLRRALEAAEDTSGRDPEDVNDRDELGAVLLDLGRLLARTGRSNDAIPLVRRASEIFEELSSTCPDLPGLQDQRDEARRLRDDPKSGLARRSP